MGIFSFDWTQIGFLGSPLMIPWWAEVHMMIGFVLLYWIIGPILYYTDVSHLFFSNRLTFILFFFFLKKRSGTLRTYRSWVPSHTTVLDSRTTSLKFFPPITRCTFKRIIIIVTSILLS